MLAHHYILFLRRGYRFMRALMDYSHVIWFSLNSLTILLCILNMSHNKIESIITRVYKYDYYVADDYNRNYRRLFAKVYI